MRALGNILRGGVILCWLLILAGFVYWGVEQYQAGRLRQVQVDQWNRDVREMERIIARMRVQRAEIEAIRQASADFKARNH